MQSASPMQLAQDCIYRLETCPEDGRFSVLRELSQRLEDASKSEAENPLVTAAGMLVTDLLNHILEDVTRAVPWDDLNYLKNTRMKALELTKAAVVCLSEYDPQNESSVEYFANIGKLLQSYGSVLDSLNVNDRQLLQQNIEGVRNG